HLKHDVGTADRVGSHIGPRGGIVGVQNTRLDSSARLDGDFSAKPDHLFDGFGGRGYARFARIGLGSDRNFHNPSDDGMVGDQTDVGILRFSQPIKYAIPMRITTMIVIDTFTKV